MGFLKRIRAAGEQLRPASVIPFRGTSVWNSASGTSQAQKQYALDDAKLAGLDFVRWSAELYQIAPNRNTSRTWTYFDHNASYSKSKGLYVLLGMTEGIVSGGSPSWDCTNKKSYAGFSAADRPYWEDLMSDVVERMHTTHGFGWDEFAVTLLNEPDNDSFGAPSDGQFGAMQMDVMDMMATCLRSRFPNLVIVAPSLSVYDTTELTWTVLSNTYMVSGDVRPVWKISDYLDFHLYPNLNGAVPPPSRFEVFSMCREMVDNAYTQLAALTGGTVFASKPFIVSELGWIYNYGQTTSYWSYGSDEEYAECLAAALKAAELDPRCHAASIYNWQNDSAGYDARSSNGAFGLRRYSTTTGDATLARVKIAKRAGVTDPGYAGATKL